MGIVIDPRWVDDKRMRLTWAVEQLDEALKARDNIGLAVAAQDIANLARALKRAAESRDVWEASW